MHHIGNSSPLIVEDMVLTMVLTYLLALESQQSEIEEEPPLDSPSHATTSLFLLAPTTSCVVVRLWEACLRPQSARAVRNRAHHSLSKPELQGLQCQNHELFNQFGGQTQLLRGKESSEM